MRSAFSGASVLATRTARRAVSAATEVQFGVGREAPGAVDDHPHRQADLAVDTAVSSSPSRNLHDLGGDAVNTQVGVAGAGGHGGQRRVGELMSRGQKVGIDSSGRFTGS